MTLRERHQIANFADFCNDCGNCDIFCPEDGGPYKIKPRFFGSEPVWRESADLDGFFVEPAKILARIDGREYALLSADGRDTYSGEGFELSFQTSDPKGTLSGQASGEVDLTFYFLMRLHPTRCPGSGPDQLHQQPRRGETRLKLTEQLEICSRPRRDAPTGVSSAAPCCSPPSGRDPRSTLSARWPRSSRHWTPQASPRRSFANELHLAALLRRLDQNQIELGGRRVPPRGAPDGGRRLRRLRSPTVRPPRRPAPCWE